VKLLRFLQEKRIQRVGGRKEIEIEARVLAATHIDLAKALETGKFREDLYYRLAVVACKLPPLRERGDDILLLAKDFLKRFGTLNGRHGLAYSPPALEAILRHSWSGNVRELQNRVQRAVIMADAKWITAADLELEATAPSDTQAQAPATNSGRSSAAAAGSGLRKAREQLEREMVTQAMAIHDGNISAAAKELGISRPTFYELMSKLGIAKD
jgi:two-component system NtrC family response regulator